MRYNASSHGRGSNLERRLAGNTENLRTFLFGAGARTEEEVTIYDALGRENTCFRGQIFGKREELTDPPTISYRSKVTGKF